MKHYRESKSTPPNKIVPGKWNRPGQIGISRPSMELSWSCDSEKDEFKIRVRILSFVFSRSVRILHYSFPLFSTFSSRHVRHSSECSVPRRLVEQDWQNRIEIFSKLLERKQKSWQSQSLDMNLQKTSKENYLTWEREGRTSWNESYELKSLDIEMLEMLEMLKCWNVGNVETQMLKQKCWKTNFSRMEIVPRKVYDNELFVIIIIIIIIIIIDNTNLK